MAEHPKEPCACPPGALAWMEGRWRGDRKGDTIEEHWSGVDAGTLMGMCRFLRDHKIRFFEFCAIEAEGDGLVMRIKHFHSELKGWEPQDDSVAFDLVAIQGERAVWCKRGEEGRWLIYERSGMTLRAWFENAGETADPNAGFHYELMS